MNNDVTSVAPDYTHAFQELREGSHPIGFLNRASLSIQSHAKRYGDDVYYRRDVNEAMTACIAFWKQYINDQLIDAGRTDSNVIDMKSSGFNSVYEQFDVCAKYAPKPKTRKEASFSKKTDWTALFRHVEDIEHYAYKLAPDLRSIAKTSDSSILDNSEDLRMTIEFVESTGKEELDE